MAKKTVFRIISILVFFLIAGSLWALSKQDGKRFYMEGYNDGYDSGSYPSPIYDVGWKLPSRVRNDKSISDYDRSIIARLYTEAYKQGWTDHYSRKIGPNPYGAWDNSSYGLYSWPYGF
ncbi:MAG: hypothetical protein LBT00_02955 [Spirochaetaceae bacterium]|jgi:hypothetical protein|nr:hypothetical protein [Spirochaetaceae bacterium]